MNNVLVIGRATVDLNPVEIYTTLDKVETFKKYVGGSACNTAIGLSRLGVNTTVLTRLSSDQFGTYVLDYLNNEKIDTSMVQFDENSKLGLTFTEIKSETESSILMYRDNVADLNLNVSEIAVDKIKDFTHVLISGTALASESSRLTVFKIVELCTLYNIPIIFDIDYRPYSWTNTESIDVYYSLLAKQANIIVGSEEEFRLMTTLSYGKTNKEIASYFLSDKAKHVVIKNGADGSSYYSKDSEYKVNIFPVDLLKSFGGGDAYMSRFIAGIINEESIEEVLLESTAHAAMLVSSHSCSDALATREKIKAFIEQSEAELSEIVKKVE